MLRTNCHLLQVALWNKVTQHHADRKQYRRIIVIMDASSPEQVIKAYLVAYNAAEHAALIRLFSQDAVVHDPVGRSQYSGIEEISDFYADAVSQGTRLEPVGEIRGSYGNRAAVALNVIATRPDTSGALVDAIDVFTFDPQGRISILEVFFGPENIHYQDAKS